MGRGKLPLRLIEKERARRITCMKRKKGLLKKAYELSTLCDIRVCMIIYDAAAEQHDLIRTYPEDPQSVHRVVADYRNYKIQNPTNSKRDLDLFDFYNDRIKKLETESEKLVESDRDRSSSSFSVWDPRIDDFTEGQLSELLARLDAKIEEVSKVRGERASAVIVYDQTQSNSDGYYYQGQDQPYFHVQPSSLVSPGFDQTVQIDDHLPVMNNNNNPFSFTKLLQAPDNNNGYGYGNFYNYSLFPAINNNYYYNAEVACQPYGSSLGQMQCFVPPLHLYCPIPTIMGSADDANNQNLYAPDLKFYDSLTLN